MSVDMILPNPAKEGEDHRANKTTTIIAAHTPTANTPTPTDTITTIKDAKPTKQTQPK